MQDKTHMTFAQKPTSVEKWLDLELERFPTSQMARAAASGSHDEPDDEVKFGLLADLLDQKAEAAREDAATAAERLRKRERDLEMER